MCLHLSTAGLRDGDGMVEVGTLLSKLASLVIREVLADSWMSEKTGIAVALTVGADVIDMLLSAFLSKLAKSKWLKYSSKYLNLLTSAAPAARGF